MPDSILSLPITRFDGAAASAAQDLVAVEEPLLIRVNGSEAATIMRTPGHDAELAAGFLFSEAVLQTAPRMEVDADGAISVAAPGCDTAPMRSFYINSSCGVCGRASIENLLERGCTRLDDAGCRIESAILPTLPEMLRRAQRIFDYTGGLHAAGLVDPGTGELTDIREDVGRHNAVDKLIGAALLRGRLPLSDRLLILSGRISFELVQKAVMAGIPMVAAVGAPSSLAVQTAHRFGLTLIGFIRGERFNIYTGAYRVTNSPVC